MIGQWELDSVNNTDLLTLCTGLPDASIDCILCDLPYGTTACSWDEIIPFEPMWAAFKRVIKPRGAIVLTASQPFTSKLIVSNIEWFKYEWIWSKSNGGGFLNANRQPLKRHENVLIFYEGSGAYYPQMSKGKPYKAKRGAAAIQVNNGGKNNIADWLTVNEGDRYPTSVLEFANETGHHPTQKPTALFSYLIRTYTQPGDIVLDPTCGSGTTAVSARECNRRYIVGDTSADYCEIARERLRTPYMLNMFDAIPTNEDAA